MQVLWANGNKGSWDHGLLMHAVRGDLWPGVGPWPEYMGVIGHGDDHALLIFAGKYLADADGIQYLRAGLDRLKGSVMVRTGDEDGVFPAEQLRGAARKLWLQWPNPNLPVRGDRYPMLGFPEDTRAWLRMQPRLAASTRRLWMFAGQNNHAVRHTMVEALQNRQDGLLVATEGFAQGLGREDYFRELAASCIVPCPPGPASPETFRMYEALEAGCIPLLYGLPPAGGWHRKDAYSYDNIYPLVFEQESRVLDSILRMEWSPSMLHATLDYFKDHPERLQTVMTETLAWWIGRKRAYALNLRDDLVAIGSPDAAAGANPVTVIIPTSPCPIHPETSMLADTISAVRSYPELRNAEILILVDGVRPELEHRRGAYDEYKRVLVDRCNWDRDWFGCWPIIFPTWSHQALMVKEALKHVRTPYLLFVEHDTKPEGEVPWGQFLSAMDCDTDINCIRLHIFHKILDEHKPLYAEGPYRPGQFTLPLVRTTQFSARPHLARTDWYRWLMGRYFDHSDQAFIEDSLTSPAEAGELPGVFIYAPTEGTMLRSVTVDGRGSDPKAPHRGMKS